MEKEELSPGQQRLGRLFEEEWSPLGGRVGGTPGEGGGGSCVWEAERVAGRRCRGVEPRSQEPSIQRIDRH